MNSVGVLLPLALLMGLGGLAAFFWALKGGQFDDMEGAANRILIDDEPIPDEAGPP
jgi:cbb3-type cytochrome oxidase maturation protein